MSNIIATGIIPALITPLNENGDLILSSVNKNMDRNYAQGASGFYICGSTGEGPVLPVSKRKKLAESVCEYNNARGIIINHVGAACPEEAFELAHHAKAVGCDAVSSVVPNFYYKYGEDEIVEYYKRLAYEAELPVIAYAQGLITGDIVSLMSRLIDIDGIAGIKYTLFDYYSMHRIKELNGGDINVINGPDEMLICGLAMGADAGIGSTYNIMCKEYCRLYSAFRNGDINLSRNIQYKINRVVEILIKYGVIRSIKYVLTVLGIDSGVASYPGQPLTDNEKALLLSELDTVGFFTEYNMD